MYAHKCKVVRRCISYRSIDMGAQTFAPKNIFRNLKILKGKIKKEFEISNLQCSEA